MKSEIFKYLKNNFSQEPKTVDRLIVSSFLYENDLKVQNNELLKEHLITENDSEEYEKLMFFLPYFEKHNSKFDFETLIELFEFVISPSDKIVNGAVYTPKHIREFIIGESFSISGAINPLTKICDPACGCGGFLYTTAKQIKSLTEKSYVDIYRENLYGLDIKNYSITRSKLLLSLLALNEGEDAKEFQFNLFEGNALNFDWHKSLNNVSGFDIIVGNPPYVCSRNIDIDSKKYLSNWSVCASGHPDLYIPFFQIGLENLRQNGVLGYITMNTFFKSVNGRALRDYFQASKFRFIVIDFGGKQVFQTKSTYTCICLIQKMQANALHYIKLSDDKILKDKTFSFNIVRYSSLDSYNGWNLQNADLINQIESVGTPLGQRYKTRNGIATLKNGIFIFDPITEDEKYYYLRNGNVYQIEKGICKEIVNPNKLTKTKSIESLKKRVIFPYYFKDENARLFPEEQFQDEFPMAYNYLRDKRKILAERDKGNGNYENWYAYGRKQSLEKLRNKLFFPHITPSIPNYLINTDENLLFYNGMAVICDNEKELVLLKKLMSSRLFWFYIINSSKPYGSGYYSLSRNYIKSFGIYDFSDEDIDFIINEDRAKELDSFFESKYKIKLQ
jgi:methylase of polypeptide subunit release factors